MINSKIVREAVTSADTFNAGSSPLGGSKVTDSVKDEIHSKVTHHRIDGDDISSNHESLIGKKKAYKPKSKKFRIGKHILKAFTPLLNKTPIGKAVAYTAGKVMSTLQSHSLDNFV